MGFIVCRVYRVDRVLNLGFVGFAGLIGCIGVYRLHRVYRACRVYGGLSGSSGLIRFLRVRVWGSGFGGVEAAPVFQGLLRLRPLHVEAGRGLLRLLFTDFL